MVDISLSQETHDAKPIGGIYGHFYAYHCSEIKEPIGTPPPPQADGKYNPNGIGGVAIAICNNVQGAIGDVGGGLMKE